MSGHAASIYSMAFSNESSLLVTGGADWTVRCWDVKGPGGSSRNSSNRESGFLNGVDQPKDYGEDGLETYVTFCLTDLSPEYFPVGRIYLPHFQPNGRQSLMYTLPLVIYALYLVLSCLRTTGDELYMYWIAVPSLLYEYNLESVCSRPLVECLKSFCLPLGLLTTLILEVRAVCYTGVLSRPWPQRRRLEGRATRLPFVSRDLPCKAI